MRAGRLEASSGQAAPAVRRRLGASPGGHRRLLRAVCSGKDIGEGARAQLPDQAICGGEDRREAKIKYNRTLQAVKCNTARSIDRAITQVSAEKARMSPPRRSATVATGDHPPL